MREQQTNRHDRTTIGLDLGDRNAIYLIIDEQFDASLAIG
jgi:hypothetical protein